MSTNLYKLGIDIGSTTVKVALLNEKDELLFADYKRHFANIRETLTNPADGSQIDDYATKDGVHFNAAGYRAWAEYLATHTVWNRRSVYSGENPYYIYGA